jgi:TPR repeat protein
MMKFKLFKLTTLAILIIFGSGIAMANTVVPPNPKKDPKQAFNYVYNLEVTQNTGDEWAEYLLGKYYETGYGTKKDIDKAYVWYRMSAQNKYKPAIKAVASLKNSMNAEQIKNDDKLYIVTRDNAIKKMLAETKYAITH